MALRPAARRALRWRAGASACALAVSVAAALAGPPLITDDPETPGKGKFELNLAYSLNVSARAGSAGRTWEHAAPLFDLNYGLRDNDQLKLEVPLEILDPAGDGTRVGIGDALLGYKYRFLDEDKATVSLSFYPQLGIPTGDKDRGLGSGRPSLRLPVQIGLHFLEDKLFLYADAGYEEQFAHGEPDSWFGGIAAEYAVSERLTICGELRYEHALRGESGGNDDGLFNVGARCKLGEPATLLVSIGRSIDPDPASGSSLLAYFGVQFSF